jgi:hypothetical protein
MAASFATDTPVLAVHLAKNSPLTDELGISRDARESIGLL